MTRGYNKLEQLQDIWANPEKYELSPAEKDVLNDLERFLETSQAYNGKIVCGDHGVGKTFTVRYLLSKINLLNDRVYVNVNASVSEKLNKEGISLALKRQTYRLVEELIKTKQPLLVLDACEILGTLDPNDFRRFVDEVHNSRDKIILVLPTELDPKIPEMTKYFPPLSKKDGENCLDNLETTEDVSEPFSFTSIIRKVVSRT
jgi:type II secretory pathway predicted ATPase ExeA